MIFSILIKHYWQNELNVKISDKTVQTKLDNPKQRMKTASPDTLSYKQKHTDYMHINSHMHASTLACSLTHIQYSYLQQQKEFLPPGWCSFCSYRNGWQQCKPLPSAAGWHWGLGRYWKPWLPLNTEENNVKLQKLERKVCYEACVIITLDFCDILSIVLKL